MPKLDYKANPRIISTRGDRISVINENEQCSSRRAKATAVAHPLVNNNENRQLPRILIRNVQLARAQRAVTRTYHRSVTTASVLRRRYSRKLESDTEFTRHWPHRPIAALIIDIGGPRRVASVF